MQSDFEPKAIKAANEKLEKHLNEVLAKKEEVLLTQSDAKETLWTKFLTLFK